jgi:hypothetical protein
MKIIKYSILIAFLLLNCEVIYYCKQCELEIEKYNKLIEMWKDYEITFKHLAYPEQLPIDKYIKEKYKWEIRKCHCQN